MLLLLTMNLTNKKPWFGPAKTSRGLFISSWLGAVVSAAFLAVLFGDIFYVYPRLLQLAVGLGAVIALGIIVHKTGDLRSNIVF